MAMRPNDNPDLSWELEKTLDRERAMEFVLQFEKTLCVYSASVAQLYSTYNLYFPEEFSRRMVVLPDPAAFNDTFNNIPEDAVLATGLHILPGELIDRRGLYLANVDAQRRLGRRKLPFAPAMRAILAQRPDDDPFLPVLMKGDLRDYDNSWPILHLHRIRLADLTERSVLEQLNVRSTILDKLETLLAKV
jgi:hypothetical protein